MKIQKIICIIAHPCCWGYKQQEKHQTVFCLYSIKAHCILYILQKALIVRVKNIPPAHWVFSSVLECIDICARRRVTICICFAPIGIFSLHLPLIGNASPHHPMLILIPLLIHTHPPQNDKYETQFESFLFKSDKTNCMWLPVWNTAEMLHRFFQVAGLADPPSARKLYLFSQFPTIVYFIQQKFTRWEDNYSGSFGSSIAQSLHRWHPPGLFCSPPSDTFRRSSVNISLGVTNAGQTITQGKERTTQPTDYGNCRDPTPTWLWSEHFYFHLFVPDSRVVWGVFYLSWPFPWETQQKVFTRKHCLLKTENETLNWITQWNTHC